MSESAGRGARPPFQSAYQRWEMASFDPPPPPPPPDRAAAAAAELAADLQRVRDAAFAEGRAAGHVEGQALGYQAGYAQGEHKGYADGQRRAAAQAEQLAALAASAQQAFEQAADAIAGDVAALALEIARQVLRAQLRHDPAALIAAAREVIAAEPRLSGAPQLFVHPDDLPIAQQYLQDELTTLGWRLNTDATLEPGGCRASAASGDIDATLATRWQRVTAALGKVDPWQA